MEIVRNMQNVHPEAAYYIAESAKVQDATDERLAELLRSAPQEQGCQEVWDEWNGMVARATREALARILLGMTQAQFAGDKLAQSFLQRHPVQSLSGVSDPKVCALCDKGFDDGEHFHTVTNEQHTGHYHQACWQKYCEELRKAQ